MGGERKEKSTWPFKEKRAVKNGLTPRNGSTTLENKLAGTGTAMEKATCSSEEYKGDKKKETLTSNFHLIRNS